MSGDLLLPVFVLLPFAAGLVTLVLPSRGRVFEIVGVATTAVTLVLGVVVFGRPDLVYSLHVGGGEVANWLDVRLVRDALNSWVALFAALFGIVVALHSVRFMASHPRRRTYYASLLFTVGASLGALFSDGVVSFVFFWGLLALLLYVMVGIDGARAQGAARKSFLIVGGADFLTLLGVVLLVHVAGKATFGEIAQNPLSATGLAGAAFALILVGALAKAGAMPFHSWIPTAAGVSPATVLAFLPASLDKLLGIYLLARLAVNLFELTYVWALVLMVIGSVTIVAAVTMALVQKDLKKLLSFHAVSQVGYMVLGIGTCTPIGVVGGLFHMLNHSLYKCCLFLCGGNVEYRTKTTELERLGGLARVMPVTFVAMAVAALAISGIPPLNGFASKWMVYQGTIDSAGWQSYQGALDGASTVPNPVWPIFLVAAMFGSALTLASFVKVIYSVFLGSRPKALGTPKEVGFPMWVPVAVLAGLCLLLGVFAQIPTARIAQSLPGGVESVHAIGLWAPGLATGLLILSLLAGVVVYRFSSRRPAEEVEVFVGGEAVDPDEMRVPGTHLYSPIKGIAFLRALFARAERGGFDPYVQVGRAGSAFVQVFRRVHTGVLTTYLLWIALGTILLLFALIGG